MAFEKKVPDWGAPGLEPPASLKESGFTAGYKPPADYFNWFMHGTGEALKELQGMTPEDIGALAEDASKDFAPAGYGLGGDMQVLTTPEELDDFRVNGWAQARFNPPLAVDENTNITFGLVSCEAWMSGDSCVQRLTDTNTGFVGRRCYHVNAWSKWEWILPPMTPDVVYLTTERQWGSPIYKKVDSASGKLMYSYNGTSWYDYAEFIGALPLTGGTLTGDVIVADSYPYLRLATPSGSPIAALYGSVSEHKTYLCTFSKGTEFYEGYGLPAADSGLTQHKWYRLLTSKEPVTVGQGGTGATDPATARSNLGAAPAPVSGTYTGNGSGTSRNFSVGGSGNVVFIEGSNNTMAIIGKGTICRDSSGSIYGLAPVCASYGGGTLYLCDDDACLNENGVTYTYYII